MIKAGLHHDKGDAPDQGAEHQRQIGFQVAMQVRNSATGPRKCSDKHNLRTCAPRRFW